MADPDRTDGASPIAFPPPARTGGVALAQTLARRRSLRAFAPHPLSLAEVGQLAWSAQGVSDAATGYRTAPSAGGTFPIELDVLAYGVPGLDDGVYRYLPGQHALRRRLAGDQRAALAAATLNQGFVAEAPVVLAFSAVAARVAARFGAIADRLADLEVGHAAQNVSLQAVALDLGSVVVAAFREADVATALELAADERPVYLVPVGRAA